MTLLTSRGLERRFGGVFAVRNLDFAMQAGAIHCMIGPNGAGKSTFFKLITGQLLPTAGSVAFRDAVVTGLRPFEVARLGIGIKTQVPKLFEDLDVRENLWIAARHRLQAHAAGRFVEELLEELNLTSIAKRPVSRLAHGQRQWVEIGGVLAGDPLLMLLDEPTAGMSDAEVERTAELLRGMRRAPSILVVEHNMRFIRMVADRVTVLHQGQKFLEGDVNTVLGDPAVRDIYLGKRYKHDA
ncbi:ATP-binding cassette domain-containing protein [Mesorhizobium sp. SP-1A]|uniref:ATP-binding cassette domain-containing protein n=1 Tax=Mesorhizobium sp. SP-1A TaxID=3077840 RepID=UPI0028F71DA3|nr:ATP-binding cassette domain-containing protein [Mesorhizobium sp. SP-1A]